jgi:hypothetical protein
MYQIILHKICKIYLSKNIRFRISRVSTCIKVNAAENLVLGGDE